MRITHPYRLAGRLERITLAHDQTHRVPLKLLAVRLPTALRLLIHLADLLWEPLFRPPPLSESRELSQTYGNSWRLYYTLLFPWDDADRDRGDGNQSWQSEALRQWDDDIHPLFCLKKDVNLPRDKRYTHLMAIRGEGSAFEYMQEHGFDELRDFAPNAILLAEVTNSNVPWMQAGDLELDEIPHEINSKDKLGIGSSKGYDKFGVGFADGSVWILDATLPFPSLKSFLTVESARKHDREKVLGKYRVEVDSAE